MWSVLSLVRQGLRRRRRRSARVADESAAAGHGADDEAAPPPSSVASALARALLAMACAVRADGEDGRAEAAWASSGWRPRADELGHLMVRESMRYAIYA